jgi:transposase
VAGKDIIKMSLIELKRLKVIQEAIAKHISQKAAASIIALSERQIRRLIRAVRDEGDQGIVHKGRGKPSNRKISAKVKTKVLKLYQKKYRGFGPTLASEKLLEMDGIKLSKETLRKWLMEAGIWQKRRKRSRHKRWRLRKECFGQMVQMDGSHHDWLEGRGSELVLMGYIDDATNTVFARFYDYEGTMPAMDSFKGYVRKYGLPQSVYLDRHTTYKSTSKLTLEQQLQGQSGPMSQFERALDELGVEVIHAYSPQAKGRIERLFGTFQDRLIKEMRLRGIKTKEEANTFLKGYLPGYNKRFRVAAANQADVHVKLPRYFNLDKYLCIKEKRTLRNDNTISHHGKLYQLEEDVKTRKVTVEQKLDGSFYIKSQGIKLKYSPITQRPKKQKPLKKPKARKSHTPAMNHPWRRYKNRKNLVSQNVTQ